MKRGQYPLEFLNILLLFLGLGIAAAGSWVWPIHCLLAGAVIAAVWAGAALKVKPRWSGPLFLLLFFLLGAWRLTAENTLSFQDIARFAGQEGEVTGTIVEAPQERVLPDGSHSWQCVLQLETGKLDAGRETNLSGRVYFSCRLRGEAPAARIGDGLRALGRVRALHGTQNPGSMDTVRSARARGITARFSARREGVQVLPQEKLAGRRWLERVRAGYRQQMEAVMPSADAAAVFAMLFGGYEGIRPELLEAFTATGIVHILSVSGSHITLVAATAAGLARLLGLGRLAGAGLVLLLIAVYSLLAGCVPPVIRSGLMGGLAFIGLALGRERDARQLLTITGLGMLLISPLLLYDISFQLSFLATAGLLYLAPRLRRWLDRLPAALAVSLSVTISAQLSVLPLLAWYFHRVSLSALLANLVAVPLVEGMIVLGLFAGLLGAFLPVVSSLVFLLDSLLLGLVYEITRLLSRLPGSQLYLPAMNLPLAALWYSGLALLWNKETWAARWHKYLPGTGRQAALIFLGVLVLSGLWGNLRPGEMAVHFIDVGQGDAALIVTPHGRAFMIDTGGTRDNLFDVGGRVDVPYLLHYGVHQLDAIFLTHVHEDHAAGAGGILQQLPVTMLYTASEGAEAYQKVMQASATQLPRRKLRALQEGEVFTIDGVRIEVLSAPQAAAASGCTTGNEVSNVLRVSFGKASFLFTGDMVAEQEAALTAQKNLRSTVLKVAHHGSKTSSSAGFLQAVQPRWAVVSVGADNSFGHPHTEVLQRLAAVGARLLRTDVHGAIVFYTNGENLRVEKFVEKE